MGKLFVGLDFFHAGAYGPDEPATEGVPAFDYSHDRDRLYLVLQPFLVGSGPDAMTLSEYLGWTGARLAEPGRLAIADGSTPLEDVEKTPVPFPPGTELQLRMSWEPGGVAGFSASRTLGRWQAEGVQTDLPADPLRLPPGALLDDPFLLPRDQWPDFALASFANPLVERWDHLTPAQQTELVSWVCALVPHLREGSSATEGTLLRQIYKEHVEGKFLEREKDLEVLKNQLVAGSIPPIAGLYQDLIQKAREDEPRLHPPRFPFRPEILRQHPEVLLPDRPPAFRVTASSYHRRLWDKLRDVLQPAPRSGNGSAEAQNEEAAARERQAALALGRLFGFGERLRWLRRDNLTLTGFENHFMILRPQAENSNAWFVTNAHSLLGQVFRIGPIDPAVALTGVSLQALTVQGIDLLAGNAPGDSPGEVIPRTQRFERDVRTFHTAVVRGQGRLFNATLQREGELTLYGPKMALGQREATFSPSGKQLFSVPGVLLDALEPAARTEMPAERDPDKAVLLRQNAPRTALTAKDLFHPEILFPSTASPWRALFQVRVKVARHAVTGSAVPVFEVTLATEAHPEEEAILRSWLGEIPARAAELWIAPAAGGPPAAFRLATVLGRGASAREQGGLLVPDADGTLDRLLEASPRGGNGEAAADLVLETRGDEPFNLLERLADPLAANEPGPLFVLNRSLTTRIGLSTEQLAERFGLTLSPSPFVGGMEQRQADPVLDHAANFNKLRIRLEHGKEQIRIHHPDAVLPLDVQPPDPQQPARPWTTSRPLRPAGPHFDYWLAHQFDQEVRDGADEAESGRFLAFVTAGRSWEIGGYVEHQYSHRIPVAGAAPVKLGRSTELVNLGNLAFRGRLAAEPDEEGPTPRAAVTYDHRKLDPETISVHFRRKAFQLALERFAGTGTAASEGKSAWLRQIYEALADLRSTLEPNGVAELLVERWNFDNRTRTGNNVAASGEPDEVPALRPRMRLVESGVFDLKQLPAPERAELDGILSLLDRTFPDFRKALAARVGPGDSGEDSEWLSLDIPLTRGTPGWQWTGTAGDPIFETTDAIRVALHLRRPLEVVVRESAGTARLLPMDLETGDAGTTLEAEIPRIRQDLPSLEARARAELQEWLSPKPDGSAPLHESFAWLRSDDVDRRRMAEPDEPADGVFDPKRHDQLFGEVSPFLNFPTDQRQTVDRVVDLYYVPFAFVPLRPHPAFGDAQTTQEFAQYLITLLDDIVQGRPFGSRLGLDPATLPADKALELREKVRRIISAPGNGRIGVARHLLELLDQVDDRKGMLSWSNEAEKNLFDRVQAQLDALNSESLESQSLKASQLDLLTRRPGLYARARAIAVGVFNPDTWSEQLYALRLYKRIREDLSIDATRGSERFDWELFTYPHFLGVGNQRYFLDVLEEGRYDNELEILPSRYQNVPASDTSRLGEIRSLAATPLARRGDAQARRAEDLIEQVHGFTPPDQDGTTHRSIEANVVHYNPEWRTRRKTTGEIERWSYILPSRRFPGIPKPILPAASRDATRQADPWRSPLIPTFPETGAIDLNAAFPLALQEVLDARRNVSLAAAVESGENPAIPARLLEQTSGGPAMASVEPGRASGWHFLETWLSHFYFVVEAGDAEQTISETLSNDVFEIETEVWATPPPLEAAQEIPGFEAKTNLQKWFLYHRTQQQGTPGAEVVTPPPGVPLADALQEMEDWLVGFAGPAPAESPTHGEVLLRRLHDKDVAEAEAASSPLGGTVMLFSLAEDGWSLKPDKGDDGTDRWNLPGGTAVGGVLAAEVMELLENETGPPRKGTFLIRVSVLDSPWSHVRARLRIRRNTRDVDGNRDADINPSFAMLTAHSDWVTFGRQVLTLGPDDFARYRLPAELRRLEVFPEGEKGISLDKWLEGPTDLVSFGPLLQRAVEQASFRDLHGQEHFFWDRQAVSADHHVVGILLQEIEDAAPRKGLAEEAQDIPQRRDLIARQHLPRVNADKLATLTDGIRHDLVLTDTPLLKATWLNAAQEAVLDVTWPVEILP